MKLFTTHLPNDKLHAAFKTIINDPQYKATQSVIQGWGAGLLERKGEQAKFINEFQTTFNSSLWELYLNKVFIDLGFSVDYTKSSPDFCVTANLNQFNVEAVISDHSSGQRDSVDLKNDRQFKDRCTIKLIGKMKDKLELYNGVRGKKSPYSSLRHVQGKPFVIAIAPFDSALSLTQNNEIINRVLFGLESPDKDSLRTGEQRRIKAIIKPSGARIELGIFTNDSYKEVSAVIFSTTGTFGKAVVESGIERTIRATYFRKMLLDEFISKEGSGNLGVKQHSLGPENLLITTRIELEGEVFGSDTHLYKSASHKETHCDGLHVYYNPYATVPFDPSIMHAREITHNFYDVENDRPIQEHPDGALVSRQLWSPRSAKLK